MWVDILTKEFLTKEILINNKDSLVIATEIGCSVDTVWRQCRKFNITKKLFISDINPEWLALWDNDKNTNMDISKLTCGSEQEAWFKCVNGHSWIQKINQINRGSQCPYCTHKRVDIGKTDMETLFPDITTIWNYNKNYPTLPSDIFPYSIKKYWWRCLLGHEWIAHPGKLIGYYKKTKKWGCPYCSNRRVLVGFNDIQTQRPDLAIEWDYERNIGFGPEDVTVGSNLIVNWVDEFGHRWRTRITHRIQDGTNCPICNESKLEKRTRNTLEKYKVKYERQKRFDGCKDIIALPFDFYLPDYNILIECQGIQHFATDHKISKKFAKSTMFSPNDLLKLKLHDEIKLLFCIDRQIRFIRISYLEMENIEEILVKELCL